MDSGTSTIVLAALSSGFASAILVKLLDILQEKLNQKRNEKLRVKQKEEALHEEYIEEKKTVYIEALKRLSGIRAGFDITYDFPYDNKRINESIDKINADATTLSAKIRLYASDEIYNMYWNLSLWSKYAFTHSSKQIKLVENAKETFSIYTTVLARLMQADLGYRDYTETSEAVLCPNCGRTHDAYKTCICGMTAIKTMELIEESFENILKKERDLYNSSLKENGEHIE